MDETLANTLQSTVQVFGNSKQALLYMALLKYGPLGAEKLHQQTKLHRETIQRELKKMLANGTITFSQTGRVKKAKAVPVATLQETLEKQVGVFDNILKPLLEVESARSNVDIKILQDSHDFGILQTKLMNLQPAGHAMNILSAQPKAWFEAMIESRKLKQSETIRLKKGIGLELLCFSDLKGQVEHMNREYFASNPNELKRKYRYVDAELSSPMQIQIWHSHIVISIFQVTPSIHITLENAEIVKAMRAYFSLLWKAGLSN